MIINETKLPGVFEIHLEPMWDERGFFARSWCQREFEQSGLSPIIAQCNVSFNEKKGTLRGMHYQARPHSECKLVRCTQGAIYDVVVDLRTESPTFTQWIGVELSSANRLMMYVPEGCGHGLLTLEDRTEIFYQMSEVFHPELSRGVRWDDPAFRIEWPVLPEIMSERDRTYPNFKLA
jgi:dTDP-4-dehydrorhamnose 3,5-epimerase